MADDKKPPAAFTTYEDDAALGKAAPSLATLKYLQGEPIDFAAKKLTLVLFWAKFAEGDYTVICDVSKLKQKYAENIQVVGVSVDPAEEHVAKFITKLGKAMPEVSVTSLEADFALAFDVDKTVRTAFQKVAAVSSIGPSNIFVVDATGNIVWREQFGQKHRLYQGQLEAQLNHLLNGTPLIQNGPKPKAAEEEEETMDCGDDDMFF
eukprot:m.220230 g.220230  ORF g.220230 m.220230 type:complete len:207 (-) comp10339_c0_seq1:43-663(-)